MNLLSLTRAWIQSAFRGKIVANRHNSRQWGAEKLQVNSLALGRPLLVLKLSQNYSQCTRAVTFGSENFLYPAPLCKAIEKAYIEQYKHKLEKLQVSCSALWCIAKSTQTTNFYKEITSYSLNSKVLMNIHKWNIISDATLKW